MSRTYIHEAADGVLVEYRRGTYDSRALFLESRVLKPNGTPHDDRWFPVSDSELLAVQLTGSDIVELLSQEVQTP